MYLQALLKQALRSRRPSARGASDSHHFSYEMVALSHATARELGYAPTPDAEDAQKPFVEVSGRKGLGVKIDDLLDLLIEQGAARSRQAQPGAQRRRSARGSREHDRASRPIRYFMLKFSRGKLIVFDIEEALSFEGETGPVPAVRRRARQQHLPEAAGARRR